MSGTPASRSARQRVLFVGGKTPSTTLLVGHTSSVICRRASSSTSAGSSIARTPWPMRVTGSSSAARTRVRAGPLAGVHRAAEARVGRDPVGLGEQLGREAGLVAGQREAHDVGMRPLGGMRGDLERPLDAEVAHGRR